MLKSENKQKNEIKQEKCKVHVMPPKITDEDITALFNGILNVMKKKIELDSQAELFSLNISVENLQKKLKQKEAECVRLKNEILYLKSKINQ